MVGNTFDDLWNQRLADAMLANWTGNVATDYEATTGFLQNMINRIGRTVVTGADSINNPFARWTDQVMDYGDTIQKYTLGYLTGYQFDPEADDPYTKVKNPPIAQYASLMSLCSIRILLITLAFSLHLQMHRLLVILLEQWFLQFTRVLDLISS